jgi:hypothetical protein
MKFTLQQKSAGKALTVFNVIDDNGGVCGSVNVPNKEVPDFVKCWKGAYTPVPKPDSRAAIVAALKRGPRLSKEAILRGS